jgi:DNA-binding NarL/FixJ family response regulator
MVRLCPDGAAPVGLLQSAAERVEAPPRTQQRQEAGAVRTLVALQGFSDLVAAGLACILEDSTNQVVAAANGHHAVDYATVARAAPAVIVLADSALNAGRCPPELGRHPTANLVVVANAPTTAYGLTSLAAGASCVTASAKARDVQTAVSFAAAGECVFIARAETAPQRRSAASTERLTKREIEVLVMLADGLAYGAIALSLSITVETARRHGQNIRRKLRVSQRREFAGLPTALFACKALADPVIEPVGMTREHQHQT